MTHFIGSHFSKQHIHVMRKAAVYTLLLLTLVSCKSIVGGGAALREDVAALEQGMTKQEVKEELGNPWDINVTSTQYGRRTQWVYKEAWSQAGQLYVYFEDGYLTGTQY